MQRTVRSPCILSLQRLKALPDHIEVLPGAFAGSVCGRRLSGKPSSTIGFERRFNAAFRIDAADASVEFMLKDIPPPPPEAAEFRAWNAGLQAVAAR
jgi:hydroxyacylglutathione hydrolase